jgi:hypothetical protein
LETYQTYISSSDEGWKLELIVLSSKIRKRVDTCKNDSGIEDVLDNIVCQWLHPTVLFCEIEWRF